MKIKFYKKLPKEFSAKYKKLESLAFDEKRTKKEQAEQDDRFCSKDDCIAYLVATEGKDIIGGCRLYKRNNIRYGSFTAVLGGFGGIWVEKDSRRKGVGTKVLEQGLNELKKAGCCLAYLCTDVENLSDFYSKANFTHLKQGHTYKGKSGKQYLDYDGMLAPVLSESKHVRFLAGYKPLDLGTGNW